MARAPIEAARVYAKLGWRTLPVVAGEKRPALTDWPSKASADLATVTRWPLEYAGCNVGAAMGGGKIALDVDPKNGGPATLAALETQHGTLTPTVQAITPSGGAHYVFRLPEGVEVRNSAGKLGAGLDIRGDGGQIVVAPSRTSQGTYRWLPSQAPWEIDLAPAPRWLLDLLAVSPANEAPAQRGYFPPASAAVLADARAALARHGPAVEGDCGDDHTFRAAAILTHDHALTEDEAWPLLVEWNAACDPPWGEGELRLKLKGGFKYATGAYGSKRKADAVERVDKLVAEWRAGDGDPAARIPDLLVKVRDLCAAISADDRHVIEGKLQEATGWGPRKLNLPRAVDLKELAAREERQAKFAAGDSSLVDAEDPLATSKRFLAAKVDAEGFAELVRWQQEFWRALGSHYEPRTDEAVNADLYGFAEGKRDVANNAEIKPDRSMIENWAHALKAAAQLEVKAAPAWIGGAGQFPAGEIIAFPNGLLHTPTRAFIPATRGFFNLNAVGFPYDPSAPAPQTWLQFVQQLWGDDVQSIVTLQEIFGLVLTTDTSFQKIFLIVGPKRSGKGTIARVLAELVGVANVTSPTLTGLGSHFGIESLIAKPLAIMSDARIGPRADLGTIVENLLRISGEDTISVPRKHRSDWTAKLSARFLILSNEIPAILDQSGALASRFVVLRLTESFLGREDRALTGKLLAELPGILLWALEGLDRLRTRGHFGQPQSALEMVRQLETMASPIKAFVADRCVIAPGASIEVGALYSAWVEWTAGQGRDHAGSKPIFGRNLQAAFPEVKTVRPRTEAGRERRYEGIRLLDLVRDGPRSQPLQLLSEVEDS